MRTRTPFVVTAYWVLHVAAFAVGVGTHTALWQRYGSLLALSVAIEVVWVMAIVLFRSLWGWRLAILGNGLAVLTPLWNKHAPVGVAVLALVYLLLLLSRDMQDWLAHETPTRSRVAAKR